MSDTAEFKEPHKGPKSQIRTLKRGENGVELGNHREQLARLKADMFYISLEESLEGIDQSSKDEWEAVMLAFDGEQMIGFGTLGRLKDGNMELGSAYVSPEYRQKGVYTQLLQDRIDLAREEGAQSVTIMPIDSNLAVSSYTKRHGFTEVFDPIEEEMIYKKILK